MDPKQKLREKTGLLEASRRRAEAKSQQVWLEDPSLHFLEFLEWSSQQTFRNVPNCDILC